MAGGFGAIHEDDDNWLSGYLATTKYGSDAKLTSNPVRQKKEEKKPEKKKEKKAYKLHASSSDTGTRRKSMSSFSLANGSRQVFPQKTEVPKVEALPDRVNAIREGPAPAGHFVREHRKSKEHPEFTTTGSRKAAKSSVTRRMSLDYDELDAVKLRVSQAAKLWGEEEEEGEDSEEQRDDVVPASTLPDVAHAAAAGQDKREKEKDKAPPKGTWFTRWQSKTASAFAS